MENHEGVFIVLAPSPGFRDVVGVVEVDDQAMLVSCGGRFEVARALKFEDKVFDVVGVWSRPHAWLIVSRAIVDESDGILVDAVK